MKIKELLSDLGRLFEQLDRGAFTVGKYYEIEPKNLRLLLQYIKDSKERNMKIAYDARKVEPTEGYSEDYNFGWVSACEYIATKLDEERNE